MGSASSQIVESLEKVTKVMENINHAVSDSDYSLNFTRHDIREIRDALFDSPVSSHGTVLDGLRRIENELKGIEMLKKINGTLEEEISWRSKDQILSFRHDILDKLKDIERAVER